MRNEFEARQTLPGLSGSRFSGPYSSMRYDPTQRSTASMLSGSHTPQMMMQEVEMARQFGMRKDTIKPAQSSAPSFYQPQNEASRFDARIGGSFRSINQSSSGDSSEDEML